MLLMEAFTLLNDERTVCTTLRWALSSCSLAPTKLYCACLTCEVTAPPRYSGREVQADLVLPVITVVVGERGIGFRTVVTRIRDPGRGGKVQGRQMAVLRLANLLAGQSSLRRACSNDRLRFSASFSRALTACGLLVLKPFTFREASSG